jgi:SAM-dependent methyltransferase
MMPLPACCVCGGAERRELWPARLPPAFDASFFSYQKKTRCHGRIVECRACGHRCVDPIPADGDRFYSEVVDPFYLATEPARKRTFAAFLDFKESLAPRRGSLLDVGCSTGVFLSLAAERGYRAEGIELSSWAVDVARARGCSVRRMGIEQLAGDAATYDAITAFDVMEHLARPQEAARTLRQRLNPGGCLVAVSPDMGSWHARLLGENHWLVILMHYHYFVRENFRRMLRNAGFARVDVYRSPPYRLPIRQARNWAEGTALAPAFRLLGRVPFVRDAELRLRAGLYAVCFAD